jgi:L-rhamnose-H+ transport protein
MQDPLLLGVIVTALSGLVMGTSPWPLKLMQQFRYEHFAFVSMLFALVICPWAITLTLCPEVWAALRTVPAGLVFKANLFSFAWGIAQVLALLCFVRIGVSLTYGILCAIGACVGVLTPMVFKASGVFAGAPGLNSAPGRTVLVGVGVMVVGVYLASLAGFGREKVLRAAASANAEASGTPGNAGGFGLGLLMVVAAGVLSAGWGFAFAYSQAPIIAAMKAHGAADFPAGVAVWAVALGGAALVNTIYPAWLLTRKKSWNVLAAQPRELVLAVTYGLLFFIPSALLGKGMLLLGALGASVGFGIVQGTLILGGQALGFLSGEWRGVTGRPRVHIGLAIFVLILSMVILALGNSLAAPASQQETLL